MMLTSPALVPLGKSAVVTVCLPVELLAGAALELISVCVLSVGVVVVAVVVWVPPVEPVDTVVDEPLVVVMGL